MMMEKCTGQHKREWSANIVEYSQIFPSGQLVIMKRKIQLLQIQFKWSLINLYSSAQWKSMTVWQFRPFRMSGRNQELKKLHGIQTLVLLKHAKYMQCLSLMRHVACSSTSFKRRMCLIICSPFSAVFDESHHLPKRHLAQAFTT